MYQGDYNQETIFSDDPVDMALKWQSMGASRIHIVDLDGAASGSLGNTDIIREIASAVLVPTQLGGGLRHLATIEQILKIGVERVILGTAAIEDRELVRAVCRRYRDSIIVGIDAREGYVATHGWREQTQIKTLDLATSMVELGVKRFIYTDITRDGTLTEPNFTAIMELVNTMNVPVIAAGGISSLSHLLLLKKIGVEGAIVGRALYTGDIHLKQALTAVAQ